MKEHLARWVVAPVHVAALATGAKCFLDDPVLASARLDEDGSHVERNPWRDAGAVSPRSESRA